MSKTRHIQRRMSQRSIREKNLEMVKLYGRRDGDKTVERMAGRGGMVLV